MFRVGINGFGRIGRSVFKHLISDSEISVVMVNDPGMNVDNAAYLYNYDSIYGRAPERCTVEDDYLVVANQRTRFYKEKQLAILLPKQLGGLDILVDASGVSAISDEFLANSENYCFKKVIFTRSMSETDKEIVFGFNHQVISSADYSVSASICDANALVHILGLLDKSLGIKSGSVTTVHPWLSYQNLMDGPVPSEASPASALTDIALGRSAVHNLIPKSTSAVTACYNVLPELKDRLLSFSYRSPTDIVSTADVTLNLRQTCSVEGLHQLLTDFAATTNGVVSTNSQPLVSSDFKGDPSSCIVDLRWCQAIGETVKLVLWYDNEFAYSARVKDIVLSLKKFC